MKKTVKIVIPVVLVLALLVILAGSLVVTQPDEYTIIKQFGAVVKIIDRPGLSFKTPFVQSASTLPKTEMLYDLAASDVITSDKKSMVADSPLSSGRSRTRSNSSRRFPEALPTLKAASTPWSTTASKPSSAP